MSDRRGLSVLLLLVSLLVVGCGNESGEAAQEETPQSEVSPTTLAATTSTTTPEPSSAPVPETTAAIVTTTTQVPSTTTTSEAPQPAASTLGQLLELGRPLVIAHAGGDQDYPHSTIYAYAQAAAAGADILELDVQLTADTALIVQHDDTVDRTTETTGRVGELTLSEIQALDNAYWFLPGRWGDQTRPDEEYVFRGVRTGLAAPPAGLNPTTSLWPRSEKWRSDSPIMCLMWRSNSRPTQTANPIPGPA